LWTLRTGTLACSSRMFSTTKTGLGWHEVPIGWPAFDRLLGAIILGIVATVAFLLATADATTRAASKVIHRYEVLFDSRRRRRRSARLRWETPAVSRCWIGQYPPPVPSGGGYTTPFLAGAATRSSTRTGDVKRTRRAGHGFEDECLGRPRQFDEAFRATTDSDYGGEVFDGGRRGATNSLSDRQSGSLHWGPCP
jgi:hypothetical protein